jgi:hypothetical protein
MSIWRPITRDQDGTFMLDGERLLRGDLLVVRRKGGQQIEVEWHDDPAGRPAAFLMLEVGTGHKKTLLSLFEGTVASWLKKRS